MPAACTLLLRFTTGIPWIKVNKNYLEINAENEMADPDSVFSYYKKLISLHHTETTLVYGDFIPMLEDSDDIYAYKRVLGDVSFPQDFLILK